MTNPLEWSILICKLVNQVIRRKGFPLKTILNLIFEVRRLFTTVKVTHHPVGKVHPALLARTEMEQLGHKPAA
ncbi:hypothetical protein A2590_02940 [Candidatus Adlerbacteria bacterium RIFOXYD1_FULL_48_8]|nr:MAG: hypothetical protein A2590_02940 [Candidatus Adlerbacteria bacterium RIFOXYD1_FULL_48_8]